MRSAGLSVDQKKFLDLNVDWRTAAPPSMLFLQQDLSGPAGNGCGHLQTPFCLPRSSVGTKCGPITVGFFFPSETHHKLPVRLTSPTHPRFAMWCCWCHCVLDVNRWCWFPVTWVARCLCWCHSVLGEMTRVFKRVIHVHLRGPFLCIPLSRRFSVLLFCGCSAFSTGSDVDPAASFP